MRIPRHPSNALRSILGLVFLVLGVLLGHSAVAYNETYVSPILTQNVPFAINVTNFVGNGAPITHFKVNISGPAGVGDADSDCFARGDPFPAVNNYSVVASYGTSTWSSYTTPASGTFYFYVKQYSDSLCTSYVGPTVQLTDPDGNTAFELTINPQASSNIFPLLDIATSTNAQIGVMAPDEICSSFSTTSTGFLDSVGAMVGRGVCIVAVYAFVPSQNAVNSVLDLRETLYDKIPFGWLEQVSSTLTQIEDGTPTSTPISFEIAAHEEMGIPTSTIDIFNPSEIPPVLDTIFDIIKAMDIAILGGLFCWYVVNKARNFKV